MGTKETFDALTPKQLDELRERFGGEPTPEQIAEYQRALADAKKEQAAREKVAAKADVADRKRSLAKLKDKVALEEKALDAAQHALATLEG